jgi:pilus assembly protein Flp/PilA
MRNFSMEMASLPRKKGGAVMLWSHKKGQGLVEYALILILIVLVVIVIVSVLGPTVGNLYSKVNNGLPQ